MLIFAGVALILGSNVAFYFVLSSVGNTAYCDVGATLSACGSVIASYAWFVMQARRPPSLAPHVRAGEACGLAVDDDPAWRRAEWYEGARTSGSGVLRSPIGHQR